MADKLKAARETAEATVEIGQAIIGDLEKHTEQMQQGVAKLEEIDKKLTESSTLFSKIPQQTKIIIVAIISILVAIVIIGFTLYNKQAK